jgi:hypothetical protein
LLSLVICSLALNHVQADAGFDARIKQLSLDRAEAFSLCSCLNGKFTYYAVVGLGDPQYSVTYFAAGRADRVFISSEETYGNKDKGFAASFEVREGRARRLWALERALTLSRGHFKIGRSVKGGNLGADLARTWALASYPMPDLMGNAPRIFDDESGTRSEDTFNTGDGYAISAAERAWLRNHGFPKANNVREAASEMRKWDALADRLRKDRERLAHACSTPTDKVLPMSPSYYFPIGRSDTVIVVRAISDLMWDVSSHKWEKGRARLQWHLRTRASRPEENEDRTYILRRRSSASVSKKIRRDLDSRSGFVEYISGKDIYMGRIMGASGEIADYGQQQTRPFETKIDEITYLRANRPWLGA